MLLGVRDAPLDGLRVEHRPAGPLAGAVLGYRGYRELASVARDRWETPAGDVILVLGLRDPFLAQQRPGIGPTTRFRSFVVGLHEQPLRTRYEGLQVGVQVRLTPPAAAVLLGVGMHELANRVVDLADLVGGAGERWAARVASAESWQQRFDVLDMVIGERVRAGDGPSSVAHRIWAALRRAGGAVRVEDLVAEAGCSHRHLVEVFRREVGLTPKRAARVVRYERAARLLRARQTTLAAVAAECGYCDQPHLTREFRRFSGVTPAAVHHAGSGQISTRR
ncbi:AraC family transcriptional regulator [Actinoplanes ianthinogenes]|uniref:AraC family transcriptional regulator n=1 Tax=Actinoplanes ianthinogenes TaxID=122358 RepID=A0ABM7LKN4_9ACTN|nr:helix-turn-helix transcriptional regulator [Actinoplanes ianthinogenes]BCJ39820.1 AraC family transcriptional regulator [Actinoplanes ianthinogenes]GGR08359.1 AraC family transcriptional regulator [Actinoplanes ianthinogenes]